MQLDELVSRRLRPAVYRAEVEAGSSAAPARPHGRLVRTLRWVAPVLILAIGSLAASLVLVSDAIEGAFRINIAAAIILATVILLNLWLILLSGFGWKYRLLIPALCVVGPVCSVLVLHHYFRRDGSLNGAGLPRLVWRTPSAAQAVPHPVVQIPAAASGRPIVLAPTSDDFPNFLGAGGKNRVEGLHLSRDWSAHPPKELWRQPIGRGWSSFAIVNGFAFTQEQQGPNEVTSCRDARSGKIRWQHVNAAHFHETMGGDGPRATPTVADGRVYVMGATGILDCLDGATGKVIWTTNVLTDAGQKNLQWGKACSPLLVDGAVIVTGGDGAPTLIAYDASSGKPRWRGGTDAAGYDTPVVATLQGKRQLVNVNAHSVAGYDLTNGQVLWTYSWPGDWPKASEPVPVGDDRVFISAGYGLGASVLQVDASNAKRLWNTRHLKTEFSNVAIRDGYVYGLDDGVLTCLDLKTGTRRWRDGRYGHGQLLLVDDLLLVQTEPGPIALVDAKPDGFHEVATFPALSAKTWNNPALSAHLLLVRNDQEAAAFELP